MRGANLNTGKVPLFWGKKKSTPRTPTSGCIGNNAKKKEVRTDVGTRTNEQKGKGDQSGNGKKPPGEQTNENS